MFWLIVYIIGAIATWLFFAYMDAKYGNPDTSRENSHGRMMSIVIWPIVVPFIVLLWIKSRSA